MGVQKTHQSTRLDNALSSALHNSEWRNDKLALREKSDATGSHKALVVIGFLLDDFKLKQPSLHFPPTWLLNQLIEPKCRNFRSSHWLKDIRLAIHDLIKDCDQALRGEIIFLEKEGSRALFPTYDGYTLKDFSQFLANFVNFTKTLEHSPEQTS